MDRDTHRGLIDCAFRTVFSATFWNNFLNWVWGFSCCWQLSHHCGYCVVLCDVPDHRGRGYVEWFSQSDLWSQSGRRGHNIYKMTGEFKAAPLTVPQPVTFLRLVWVQSDWCVCDPRQAPQKINENIPKLPVMSEISKRFLSFSKICYFSA